MYNLLSKIHNTSNIKYYSIYDVFPRSLRSECVFVCVKVCLCVKIYLCMWKCVYVCGKIFLCVKMYVRKFTYPNVLINMMGHGFEMTQYDPT